MKSELLNRYKICIKSLEVLASVGFLDIEKQHNQRLEITLICDYKMSRSDKSSFLDYAKLVEEIKSIVKSRHFDLLEELCDEILQYLKAQKISSGFVEITKPELHKICNINENCSISVASKF